MRARVRGLRAGQGVEDVSARERAHQALRAAREALAQAEIDYLYACGWKTKVSYTALRERVWEWYPPHGLLAPVGTAPGGPLHVSCALQLAEAGEAKA